MIRKLVQYRIKPNAAPAVRDAIVGFVDAIAANEADTIYGAFVADDGVSFTHAMAFPSEEAEARHRTAAHTKAFVEALDSQCEAEPVVTSIALVRSTKKGAGFLGMGR